MERLGTSTADGTSMLVEPIAETTVAARTWYRDPHAGAAQLAHRAGCPQSALGPLRTVRTWLIVNTEHLRATLIESGRTIFSAPHRHRQELHAHAARQLLRDRPARRPRVRGRVRSARVRHQREVAVLTDWPGGGVVGIHGTNEPQLIPGHPSHGCIRMRNQDILRLGKLMPVGTPVTIE